MFDHAGKGLEIGPSHNPLMPKAAGFDVEVLDHLDADGLRQKYAGSGVNEQAIEEVDYVSDGRPMPEVIGDRHRFDWIVASHVIEHVPDLVSFLNDCSALLKTGGSVILAVPDKRCCFDVLRPVSTVGQVLQAHLDGRVRPAPGVIFDDVAYARRRGGRVGWGLGEQQPLEEVRSLAESWEVFERARDSDTYHDVHCWVFVPSSFRLIMNTLADCGLTKLRESKFELGAGEFYIVLSERPETCDLSLGDLACMAQEEERAALPISVIKPIPTEPRLEDVRDGPHRTSESFLRKRTHSVRAALKRWLR
jgi:SAM-dependent methyltransferase